MKTDEILAEHRRVVDEFAAVTLRLETTKPNSLPDIERHNKLYERLMGLLNQLKISN